jgi:hypothetical protein
VFSGDFDGLLLHMAIGGRELIGEDDDAWYVYAPVPAKTGINWSPGRCSRAGRDSRTWR